MRPRKIGARRRAFTLLEVLMVIVILGVLATLVITQLGGTEQKAKKDLTMSQIKGVLAPKVELFRTHCGRYPTTQEGLRVLLDPPDDEETAKQWAGPYVEPKQLKDAWGHDFAYTYPGEYNQKGYDLSSPGPDGQAGTDDDITNWEKT